MTSLPPRDYENGRRGGDSGHKETVGEILEPRLKGFEREDSWSPGVAEPWVRSSGRVKSASERLSQVSSCCAGAGSARLPLLGGVERRNTQAVDMKA